MSRDFLDFSERDGGYSAEVFVHPEPGQAGVADVVFYGLSIVLPLLPIRMLQVEVCAMQPLLRVTQRLMPGSRR